MDDVATTMIPEPDAPRRVRADRAPHRERPPDARVARRAAAHPQRAQRVRRARCSTRRRSGSSSPRCDSTTGFVWVARVRAHGPRPRAVRGADARSRAPPAVPQPQASTTGSGRWLLGFPSFTPIDLVPARAHGAPPRRVRPRRARHPALPRLPDLRATRCAASSRATPTGQTGWKLFKGLLRAVRVAEPARALPGPRASSPCSSS